MDRGTGRRGGYQEDTANSVCIACHASGMEKVQRRFGAGIGAWLRQAAAEEGCTRGSLARGLCEAADWRNAKGELCRVFDIARAARETPDAPTVDTVPEDAPGILRIALRSCGARPRAPPDPIIRESAVELARFAGTAGSIPRRSRPPQPCRRRDPRRRPQS